MGQPAAAGVAASGSPPSGDRANAYLAGSIAAIGPTDPIAFWGPFNVAIWAQIKHSLTTVAGSLAATVDSAAGLAVGQGINSVNVPAGTTIGVLAGTNITLALPPSAKQPAIVAGVDAAALFDNIAWGASSVQLERSFDGGQTWITCGIGGAGQQAVWTAGTSVSVVAGEPEQVVLYRLNCTLYGGTPLNYRLSTTGGASVSWSPSIG